ncbi:hypothetical protein PY364_09060, partial [Kamptonema sp. UHCC 0994]|nr:hypothetical protein [Kamptonema sp. UHCC 0994]
AAILAVKSPPRWRRYGYFCVSLKNAHSTFIIKLLNYQSPVTHYQKHDIICFGFTYLRHGFFR